MTETLNPDVFNENLTNEAVDQQFEEITAGLGTVAELGRRTLLETLGEEAGQDEDDNRGRIVMSTPIRSHEQPDSY